MTKDGTEMIDFLIELLEDQEGVTHETKEST